MSTTLGLALAERGLLPDSVVRKGIRSLLRRRLRDEDRANGREEFLRSLRRGPIAVETGKANEQHYEVPAEFFRLVLGRRLKYSSCYWPRGVRDLDEAEEAMLALTCERAGIEDGMDVLDLGCGWGSLSLYVAERFPRCRVLAVSNSALQRRFVEERAPANVRVRTADVNGFEPGETFDRVVSVEMFEHMRNYALLFERIASWLRPEGRLFVHVFCHRHHAYPFETEGSGNWMGRHFFTGGVMPSEDLLPRFREHVALEEQWPVDGRHYARTAEAWLRNLDRKREEVRAVFREAHGRTEARRWLERWRIFFLACAELFGYGDGAEWRVAHYRFRRR